MSPLIATLYDASGEVQSVTLVTEAELRQAHESKTCGSWCSYCYAESCAEKKPSRGF